MVFDERCPQGCETHVVFRLVTVAQSHVGRKDTFKNVCKYEGEIIAIKYIISKITEVLSGPTQALCKYRWKAMNIVQRPTNHPQRVGGKKQGVTALQNDLHRITATCKPSQGIMNKHSAKSTFPGAIYPFSRKSRSLSDIRPSQRHRARV